MDASGQLYCSVCRRRPPIYLRSFSGQRLCMPCLEEALSWGVKRSLRGVNAFRPGVTVAVYIAGIDPGSGVALVLTLSRVERAYGGRVLAVIPSYIELSGRALSLLEGAARIARLDFRGLEGEVWAPRLMRVERALAAIAARDYGAQVALLPLTRSHMAMIGLEAFMSGLHEYLWDISRPCVEVDGLCVAAGFRSLETEPVAAYAALQGIDYSTRVEPLYRYKRVFASVADRGRPELVYSSLGVAEALASRYEGLEGRCRYCGAPSNSEVCGDCSSLLGRAAQRS